MRQFGWLGSGDIPQVYDLRRCGWQLLGVTADGPSFQTPLLAEVGRADPEHWARLIQGGDRQMQRILLLGVDDWNERTWLLHRGFGDVLGSDLSLGEVEARAARLASQADTLPRTRRIKGLQLDLFARDGFVESRRLGLHPREFALLWLLAETPGVAVARMTLLREVWRIAHCPETNRVAVHIFRLRAKLAVFGLQDLVGTARAGGYVLITDPAAAPPPPPFLLGAPAAGLDEALVLREGPEAALIAGIFE